MSNQVENARLAWRQAQVELQSAIDELEKRIAESADRETVQAARSLVVQRKEEADNLLQRYITRLGKSQ